MEKICVAVRVRPAVKEDYNSSNGTFWRITQNSIISLHKLTGSPISPLSFSFDHVFDQSCSNSRVYDFLTKDIIFAALEGFNGTVFAYGQTSSGKTYTMNGSENDPGIIHRAVKDVFDIIQKNHKREFLIRVSYMEIYNEEINDLLVMGNHKLPIHESLERGVFVAGLREEMVNNAEQVHKLLEAGEVNRHFGETNMNVRSSRSHTIFRMVIESKSKEMDCSDAIRVSVLNLVDLAGSERIAKTGADGVRLKEGKHINKSLMVLGNVINKLSEGAKQRGHIPYRDSKLTRILQFALGGNAKTSIICTVAPEEVHVEETKGTLQFASRAKRVTNCAQVNEILTDAALLKRQKIEIEELRDKLQGSRSEVLEQEILKLRNDLLKYELEHEKLATELEEERRLHRLRDEHMKEQQLKIDNLSNLANFSDSDTKSCGQKQAFSRRPFNETNNTNSNAQEQVFDTPRIEKPNPKSFVAQRSHYSDISNCYTSPLPDVFNNVVDEDAWVKLNRGYVADLDLLHTTPVVKVRSPSSDGISTGFSKDHYEQDITNLKRQLELANKDKDEAEKNLKEKVQMNNELTKEIEELKNQVKSSQQIPLMLRESVATCRDIYEDLFSVMHSSVSDEKSFAKNLFSGLSEIGKNLFSTLETHCTMALDGNNKPISNDTSLLQQQCKFLCERLNNTVALLATSEFNQEFSSKRCNSDYKGPNFGEKPACWKEKLISELNIIKETYINLEKDLDPNIQILEDTKARYQYLEGEFDVMKEERDSLLNKLSRTEENLSFVSQQSSIFLEKYNAEIQKRRNLEEEMKTLISAFDARKRLLRSFYGDFKLRIDGIRAQNPNLVPDIHKC